MTSYSWVWPGTLRSPSSSDDFNQSLSTRVSGLKPIGSKAHGQMGNNMLYMWSSGWLAYQNSSSSQPCQTCLSSVSLPITSNAWPSTWILISLSQCPTHLLLRSTITHGGPSRPQTHQDPALCPGRGMVIKSFQTPHN